MLLKTILVVAVIYLLIKVISRIFLPPSTRKNARIIFRTFKNINRQTNQKSGGNRPGGQSGKMRRDGFEEIEEAEYEELTDDSEEASESSNQ